MNEIILFATILAPIVLSVIELGKRTFNLPKRLVPIVGVILGMLVATAAGTFSDLSLEMRLWAGFLSGLSATGLFELVKKTFDLKGGK